MPSTTLSPLPLMELATGRITVTPGRFVDDASFPVSS